MIFSLPTRDSRKTLETGIKVWRHQFRFLSLRFTWEWTQAPAIEHQFLAATLLRYSKKKDVFMHGMTYAPVMN